MKKTILLFAAALLVTGVRAADDLTLKSPDGTVKVSRGMKERGAAVWGARRRQHGAHRLRDGYEHGRQADGREA